MSTRSPTLSLSRSVKRQLKSLISGKGTPAIAARKCRAILLASDGMSNSAIAKWVQLSRPTVIATIRVFAESGVKTLARAKETRPYQRVLTQQLEQAILDTVTTASVVAGRSWSTRTLANHLCCSRMMVHRVLRQHGMRLQKTVVLPKDLCFAQRVQDVIGLYMSASVSAIVLSLGRHPNEPVSAPSVSSLYGALAMLSDHVTTHRVAEDQTKTVLRFLAKSERGLPSRLCVIMHGDRAHEMAVRSWRKQRLQLHLSVTRKRNAWLGAIERLLMSERDSKNAGHLLDVIYRRLASRAMHDCPFTWSAGVKHERDKASTAAT